MKGRHCPARKAERRSFGMPSASARLPFLLLVLLALCSGAGPGAVAHAETLNDRLANRSQSASDGKDRLLVQADQLDYNRDNNTVGARGHVQLYYQGRVLQADRVVYNRDTNRVMAEGHAKLTEIDGSVAYGEKFELTDDFKNGFIDSLRADTADKTHFSAGRVERAEGETSVFERGTYTACEPCKNDPSKPPTWQVKAKRIIHKNSEQTIYYEDATLELWGMPVAYLPFFSTPDPSVKRKSGFLAPRYSVKSQIGFGLSVPYFWALAPDYDLTLTPTYYTRQGLLAEAEWRQRFVNGSYSIRAAGIFQQDTGAFSPAPYGPGNKQFRGEIDTDALFYINDKWKYGWSISLLSDKWFQQDYRLPGENISAWYFKEKASTIFVTGQGDRGFLDLRGIYFQALSRYDLQRQQPLVAPVLDYNKTFDLDPKKTVIGGQVEIDANVTHISRDLAAYQSIGARRLDQAYGLYDVCETAAGVPAYNRNSCLLRGIGGDYTRATLNLSWKRKFVDPIGEVWTPFAFAHLNGSFLNLNGTNSLTLASTNGTSIISNADQGTFAGSQGQTFRGQATPGAGLEWRYPFIARTDWATHVFEPIAQVIVRPDETTNRALVNEDSQSLVFDDTNLFEWNRFSGYDRFEGGTRANYGAQYTMTFNNGGSANILAGQSFQLAGRNSYASPDAANIGLSSGLDTRASDYVGRIAIAPTSTFAFIAKTRLDPSDFSLRRLDLMGTATIGKLEAGLQYARYEAQPLIGFPKRREGISATTKYKFNQNWFATGNVVFDMSRHLYNNQSQFTGNAPLFALAGVGVGGGYTDDCLTLNVSYSSVYQDNGTGTTPTRNQTVLLQLQLRTLGDTTVKSGLSDIKVQDGLSSRTQ